MWRITQAQITPAYAVQKALQLALFFLTYRTWQKRNIGTMLLLVLFFALNEVQFISWTTNWLENSGESLQDRKRETA